MSHQSIDCDVLIIGGGYIGLEAAAVAAPDDFRGETVPATLEAVLELIGA